MTFYKAVILFLCAAALSSSAFARNRDQIRIVGSSTVYPFTTAVAEKFGRTTLFKTPVVESTGTGGGFKLFCGGIGPNAPDITDASRRILPEEAQACTKNNIDNILEIPIGYDGIVLAGKNTAPLFTLTKEQIFKALARQVPGKNGLSDNPYKIWHDIDPSLPIQPIQIYGPPTTSGTRDAFVELVMDKACESFPEFKSAYPDEKDRKKNCGLLREDGVYIEAGENGNIVVQKLTQNPDALGILGYSFLEQNGNALHAATIGGIAPTSKNILGGFYPISRGLYLYVKRQHMDFTPAIKEFLTEYTSEPAFGPDGYLAEQGLIPLNDEQRAKARRAVAGLE